MPSIRLINLAIFVACVVVMLTVYFYFQQALGLAPCALCLTQRAFVIAVGVFALISFIVNPKTLGRRVFAGLGLIASIAGAYFAGHHLWLQSLPPDQAPPCGPGLAYILEAYPIQKGLEVLLRGDGNCAETLWEMPILGLSIPGVSLLGFVVLIGLSIWQLLRRK